jgi:hypothetical protein
MNKIILSLFICANVYAAEADMSPENMYPTDASNIFNNTPSSVNDASHKSFDSVTYSPQGTVVNTVTPSELNTSSVDNFGEIKISSDMNWTDPAKLEKFYKDNTQTYLGKSNNLVQDFRKKASNKFKDRTGRELNNLDLKDFSDVAITQNFEEESDARSVLAFKKELYRDMRAKLVINTSISCYISRQLNNSYFCPIPGQGVTTYGGSAKDSKEAAILKCNEGCRVPTQCIEHKNNDNMTYSNTGVYTLPVPDLQLPLNPSQITRELSFNYLPQNINDIQDENFDDEKVRSRVTVSGIDPNNNPVYLYDKYDYTLKKEGGKIRLSINKKLKRIDLHFFNSYIFDSRYFANVSLYGDNPSVEISNISAGYLSDKRYFCPITQFESDARKCDGVIKMISFGGPSYSVCVPEEDTLSPTRSAIDGGYYREDQCAAACWESDECVPTYRHLTYNQNNLPDSMYNLEYGCVDSDDNAGCTKERCKQLFENDTQPVKEKIWEKDDTVVETVTSGVSVAGTTRPRVDFAAELSSADQNRQELFTQEMKDVAYKYMVEEESFNVSKEKIEIIIPQKTAVDVRVNNATAQISMSLLYKPKSDLVDSGKTVYVYPVIEMSMSYRPIKPFSSGSRLYYPDRDHRIKARDKVFLLKNEVSKEWIPFKRIFTYQYYLPIQLENGRVEYKWIDTPSSEKVHIDTYLKDIKAFGAYGNGYMPTNPLSFNPNSDKPWENFLLFKNLGSVASQEGVLFMSNAAATKKVYDPLAVNNTTRAYYDGYKLHIISNIDARFSFTQLSSKINDSTVVYDSKRPNSTKVEIEPDSLYADDRVKLYTLGTKEKRTVFMKVKPKSTEEEHKGIIFMFTHE